MILSLSLNSTKTTIQSDTDSETASSLYQVFFYLMSAEQARELV